jgi:CDP-diacylglycerol--serine O-phosphatidyltransferase
MPRISSSLKPVRLLPNLVTTASLAFGLMAMYHMVARNDESVLACWFILVAAVLDALDGMIARLTRTESEFGVQYDSLADAIVFGTTPAILMFLHLRGPEFVQGSLLVKMAQFSCITFTICGVLRLARFNVEKDASSRKSFTGLPIPAAAAAVVSCYLVIRSIELPAVLLAMPVVMIVLALAMVSRFEYHSIKSVDLESPREFDTLLGAVLIMAAVFVLRAHLEWMIFLAMVAYVASGPVGAWLRWRRRAAADEAGAGEGGAPDDGENPVAAPPAAAGEADAQGARSASIEILHRDERA